jgi:hypothetical protein
MVIVLLLESVSDFVVMPLLNCYFLNEMTVFNKKTNVLLIGRKIWEVSHVHLTQPMDLV